MIRVPRLNLLAGLIPFRTFAVILLLVVALLFAFALGALVLTAYKYNSQASMTRQEIAALKEANARLEKRRAYLREDAAVEQLAREELGWIRPGDTAIVVVPVGDLPPPATAVSTTQSQSISYPARWLQFLLGR